MRMKPLGWWGKPLAFVYGLVVRFRNWLYDTGWLRSVRTTTPVWVIGNLSTGGTGKTPVVIAMARSLRDAGLRPGILSRGYGRRSNQLIEVTREYLASEVGDEPLLIKDCLPDVPVVVNAHRLAGVYYLTRRYRPDIILLDDGFQHRLIHPHCAVVLMSAHRPYDEDLLLPAGYLREPLSALRRASALLITKVNSSFVLSVDQWRRRLLLPSDFPVWLVPFRYAPLRLLQKGDFPLPQRPLFVAGLADPAPAEVHLRKLFRTLEVRYYPDHHPYSESDVRQVELYAHRLGNDGIITTAKDAVKLKRWIRTSSLPWWVLPVEAELPHSFIQWVLKTL